MDLYVRCTTFQTVYNVKISVARAMQLRRLIVGKKKVKNASLALYIIYNDAMNMKV